MWQTLSLAGLSCLVLASTAPVHAQSTEKRDKLGEYDEIIIKRKSGQDGKVNVEVRNGKVFVDGQPVDQYNNPDFSVRQRSVRPVDGNRMMRPQRGGEWFALPPASARTNQALLGVITEKAEAKGVTVRQVGKDTPAEKAGLQVGDVITAIDDHAIDEPQSLFETIGSYKPGDEVKVTYLRKGQEKKASAILGKHQADLGNLYNMEPGNDDDSPFGNILPGNPFGNMPPGMPRRYFDYGDSFRNPRPRLGLSLQDDEAGKGAKVTDVLAGTSAASAGFAMDDLVIQLNDTKITSARDFADAYKRDKEKGQLTVTVIRNGETKTLTVKAPKQLNKVDL